MQERFVPATTIAERLGVVPDTVTRWCREGRIPGVKLGRDWRIPESVVEDLLAARPARLWTADLERQLRSLRPPDHVLVLVPGRSSDARRFLEILALIGGEVAASPEPPPPPEGGIFARAVLVAAGRAASEADGELAGGPDEGWLVRWVSRLPSEVDATERRIAAASKERGRVAFCLMPLAGDPDLGPVLALHTHILLAAVHGRSWLGRSAAPMAAVGWR
ncbi:MAG: helix-turn-helix domain-containing protein [Actinomycetota bacterium]